MSPSIYIERMCGYLEIHKTIRSDQFHVPPPEWVKLDSYVKL